MTNASEQFVRPAKNDGSIEYGVSELQHENKYLKDKCLESKQRIRISYEDSICRGNYRTSQGILLYLGNMISVDATEKSREEYIATTASIWFEGGRGSGSKNFDFYRQISEKFQFFQAILQKNIEFCRQISENFDFFRQLKKFDFPSKKFSIYSNLWANYSIYLQK